MCVCVCVFVCNCVLYVFALTSLYNLIVLDGEMEIIIFFSNSIILSPKNLLSLSQRGNMGCSSQWRRGRMGRGHQWRLWARVGWIGRSREAS